jgi:FKBP-type peptidyl-prolyl cis-trans isomerase
MTPTVTRILCVVTILVSALPIVASCSQAKHPSRAERRQELLETRPKFVHHAGGPPAKLQVRVLKRGSGPHARKGNRLGIIYVGFNYETGEEMYRHWALHPLPFTLGSEYLAAGIERGIRGVRLGERRELILPPDLAYGTNTIEYFIQLASLNGRESG